MSEKMCLGFFFVVFCFFKWCSWHLVWAIKSLTEENVPLGRNETCVPLNMGKAPLNLVAFDNSAIRDFKVKQGSVTLLTFRLKIATVKWLNDEVPSNTCMLKSFLIRVKKMNVFFPVYSIEIREENKYTE